MNTPESTNLNSYADFIKSITKEGETHICATVLDDGSTMHTFLMPENPAIKINWQDAMEHAKSIGGDLPSRAEFIQLYEKHAEQFERDWYWSNTQRASGSDYAWYQSFYTGVQYGYNKDSECRPRFVRRLVI